MWFGVWRFVVGDIIELVVKIVKRLNRFGLCVIIDYLGEYVVLEKKVN